MAALALLLALASAGPAMGSDFASCWRVEAEAPALVLLWSPAMPLSLRALSDAENSAKAHGLRFCAAVNPGDSPELVAKTAKTRGIERYASPASAADLPDPNLLLHFPSLVLVAHGRKISPLLPGYDSADSLEKFLARHLPFGAACKTQYQEPESVALSDAPDWLFSIFPDGEFAAYSSAEDENFVLHLASRSKIRVPGAADFALSPDAGRDSGIATAPSETGEVFPGTHVIRPETMKNDHMDFYWLPDILACKPVVLYQDKALIGNYQVVARLGGGAGDARYRVMAAREGLHFRDYLLTFVGGKPRLRPAGKLRKLCPGLELRLPKLSPDGKELAAFDVAMSHTKIFRVNDDGKCTETMDLGIATGKVDFDPSSSRIAFHAMGGATACAKGVNACADRVPEGAFGADVHVWNRTAGARAKLTSNKGASSMFPRFTRDGRLAVQTIPNDPKRPLVYELIPREKLP